MKKLFKFSFPAIMLFLMANQCFGQPVDGKKFELSIGASMYTVSDGNGNSSTVFNLPLRVGYFIYRGLEIEPELNITIPEGSDNGYFILLNVLYNLKVKGKVVPFILAGGGIGNGYRAYNIVLNNDMTVSALNFGAGLRILMGNSAAFRLEYRFTKYSGEKTTTLWGRSYTSELDRTDNNFHFGISIFL